MNRKYRIPINYEDRLDQKIKIEPYDNITVEEEDIDQVFGSSSHRAYRFGNNINYPNSTEIITEIDGIDEIVKEEPQFYDELADSQQQVFSKRIRTSKRVAKLDCKPVQKTEGKEKKQSSPGKLVRKAKFECFLCRKRLRKWLNLKYHYDRFHGKQNENVQCDLCSRRFSTKYSLDNHRRSHTDAFKCKLCLRCFSCQNNLRRHHKSCTALKCNICHKKFQLQSELIQHMLVHTMRKTFECDICSSKFTTKRNIKRHMRLHNRKGLYQCEYCDKEYTTKYARDAHQRKHKSRV